MCEEPGKGVSLEAFPLVYMRIFVLPREQLRERMVISLAGKVLGKKSPKSLD